MAKILVVDDDAHHTQMMAAFLSKDNHVVDVANTGAEAMHLLTISPYEVVVLDWTLPDHAGVEILKWYRQKGSALVIMLTGKNTLDDREQGLDAGADDYMVKPFNGRELSARIRAVLRRSSRYVDSFETARGYVLNPSALTVTKHPQEIRLPPREFALLEFLARHPTESFKGEALLSRVWSAESETTAESVRTTVKEIRKKLSDDGVIETIAGAGYKLGGPAGHQ